MMRIHNRVWIAMLFVVVCPLSLEAQQADSVKSRSSSKEHETRGPVQVLIRDRVRLELTDDQVVRLQEVDRQMEEMNRPLVSQLMQIRRQLPATSGKGREMTDEQRQAYRAQMRAAKPILEKIEHNNHQSMRQIGNILTAEQKARVRGLLYGDRDSNGDRDKRGRSDGNRN